MKNLEIILIVIGIINITVYLLSKRKKRKKKLKLFYEICEGSWCGMDSYYGIIYTFNKDLKYKEVFRTSRYFDKSEADKDTKTYMENMLKCQNDE